MPPLINPRSAGWFQQSAFLLLRQLLVGGFSQIEPGEGLLDVASANPGAA